MSSDLLFDLAYPTADRDGFEDFVPADIKISHVDLTTEDGYIIRLYQLEHESKVDSSLPPIYLQHGFAASAASWLINEEKSGAYHFCRLGFKVYVLNGRGSPMSQTHTKYDATSAEYWDFSLEDLAYDTIAAVDYIHARENKKVVYMGHSQGAVQILAALGDDRFKAHLKKKLYKVYPTAPVVCIKNGNAPMVLLGHKFIDFMHGLKDYGVKVHGATKLKNNHYRSLMERLYNFICGLHQNICFWTFWGMDHSNEFNNMARYGTWANLHPSAAPHKGTLHFLQLANHSTEVNCNLRRFDYGPEENLRKYGSAIAPKFNISEIDVPMKVFFGTADKYYNETDIEDFKSLMKNVPEFETHVFKGWGHITFVLGLKSDDLYDLVAEDIKKRLKKHPLK